MCVGLRESVHGCVRGVRVWGGWLNMMVYLESENYVLGSLTIRLEVFEGV